MKALLALAVVLTMWAGAVPPAQAAGSVPGQGRTLYQYGE